MTMMMTSTKQILADKNLKKIILTRKHLNYYLKNKLVRCRHRTVEDVMRPREVYTCRYLGSQIENAIILYLSDCK